ncbi:MAG TPA: DinB family protein [Tepidisphaeraceae bacterium]|nr:DinB family protein [Tepidisphaeraceae bacterium]
MIIPATRTKAIRSPHTTDYLVREIAYLDLRGQGASLPLDQQILHVVDHATYHRGQLNSMIRRAAGTPANTMNWSFVQAGRPRDQIQAHRGTDGR